MVNVQKKEDILYLNRVKIDSFKLNIPISLVKRFPESYYYPDLRVAQLTGEKKGIIEDKSNRLKDYLGISTLWGISKCKGFLQLAINTKQLKHNYFEGLNLNNIPDCYNLIRDRFPDLEITFDDFLNGTVVDIDFCKDIEIENLLNGKKDLMSKVRLSVLNKENKVTTQRDRIGFFDGKNVKRVITKNTSGFEINKRLNSKITNPHTKGYSKFLDLTTNSILFGQIYFGDSLNLLENVFRLETKLNDREQLLKVVKSNKLKDVLKFDFTDRLNRVFDDYGLSWLTGYIAKSEKYKELNIKEILKDSFLREKAIIIDLTFENMILKSDSEFKMFTNHLYIESLIYEIVESVTSKQNCRVLKSRKGLEIELFSQYIANQYRDKINAPLN